MLTFRNYFKSIIESTSLSREETIQKLSGFLKGGLSGYAEDFVDAGEKYNVDPFLMASIATLETGWGKAPVLTKYKNISGRYDSSKKTHYVYTDVKDSIYDQARFLRQNYLDKGLTTIEAIGAKYAPPGASNDPKGTNAQWPQNVSKLYSQVTGNESLIAAGSYDSKGNVQYKDEEEGFQNTIMGNLAKVKSGFEDLLKPYSQL
jgi:beta-N-acetylglucosaminidase